MLTPERIGCCHRSLSIYTKFRRKIVLTEKNNKDGCRSAND